MTTNASEPARKPATKKEVSEAIKKGHYAKATKLLKSCDLEDDVKEAIKKEIQPLWDKQKAENKKKAASKAKAKPKAAEKMPASVDSIMEKYNALVAEIAAFEVDRRAQKKHANFFTRHRRQVEVMARNFEKFARR